MNVQKAIFCGSRAIQPGQKIHPLAVKEMGGVRINLANRKPFHITAQQKYPLAKNLPLPNNISAIMSVEIGQFSPQRARDISGPVIYSKSHDTFQASQHPVFSKTFNQFLESYDCKGAVSCHSVMQTNVPDPFQAKGNTMYDSNYLSMPGGQYEQGTKLISEDMQRSHYLHCVNNKKKQGIHMLHTLTNNQNLTPPSSIMLRRLESTSTSESTQNQTQTRALTTKEKFKRAVAEYGSTVIIFHVGISLASLGACYTLVSSGLDMETFLKYVPWLDSTSSISQNAKNAGTFVTAYAIHKVMAPVRISITLTSVPFIVRYLRKIGFLKK